MDSTEREYHRTLVQFLIDTEQRELAALMIDGGVEMLRGGDEGYPYGLALDVPSSGYDLLSSDESLKPTLIAAARAIMEGRISSGHTRHPPAVTIRVKLMEVEEGWQNVARELIVNAKGVSNQGAVSKLMARRAGREAITYNELNYASQSEVRVAQELEDRAILFFPLAVGVRADTGQFYRDHREVDFLVCEDGVWGILECSYHPDRYEKDAEKDAWFKKSGILCVQHYTAERCYRESAKVVEEFLSILRKHRR